MPKFDKEAFLAPLVLILITAVVYWPGLSGAFIFDDYPNIVTNPAVQHDVLNWEALKSAARAYEAGEIGRPLATIGFAVDYAIGGKNPFVYKLHSLLVHLLNAVLVFALLRRLLKAADSTRGRALTWPVAAFATALLWVVHPLQVSSVLYVVQRMETLSLTFVLAGMLAYMHGRVLQRDGLRGWPWLVSAAAFAFVALLSKENAVLFPLYTLAIELTLLGFSAKHMRTERFLRVAYAAGLALGVLAFLVLVLPKYVSPNAFLGRDFSLAERLFTQLRVLPMYIGQMLLPLPSKMVFYYDSFEKSTGLLNPLTTLVGAVFLVSLLSAAWRLRKKLPLAALGVFWFFSAHVLTSNVFNLELAFEHRNYFALLGVLLVFMDVVRRVEFKDGPGLKYISVGAVIAVFSFLALLRSATWGDELHLATYLVAKNPSSARASNDLGTLYYGMSDNNPDSPFFGMAMAEFERGSLLPSASALPEQGLILMTAAADLPQRSEWWDRLIEKTRTRALSPQDILAVRGLMKQRYAGVAVDNERLSEAYAVLLERSPRPQFFVQYGDYALKFLNNEELADRMFAAAVQAAPKDGEFAYRIASALLSDGRIRQAKVVLDRADELGVQLPSDLDTSTTEPFQLDAG